MGLIGNWKGQQAMLAHQKGEYDKAADLYEEAMKKGVSKPAILIGYAVLLLRRGSYQEGVDLLRKAEKMPGITKEQKNQILLHYSVGIWKLGHLDRAIEFLQELFRRNKTGVLYETLGYLMVETGDFEAALAFNKDAVDYDEEDAICLDNLGQTYFRLGNDWEAAKPLFEKAYELKPEQIDTLYFLAQYDAREGRFDAAMDKLQKALEGRFSPLNYATRERVEEQIRIVEGKKRKAAQKT